MIKEIRIRNFKCFKDVVISMNKSTLLLGVNSGGKSSVLQALALINICNSKLELNKGFIDLNNNKYGIDLYSFNEIINKDSYEEQFDIRLKDEEGITRGVFYETDDINTIEYKLSEEGSMTRGLIYLSSERSLSKIQKRGNSRNIELGKKNEYLAYIIEKGQKSKISIFKERNCPFSDDTNALNMQINNWLDYVLPGNYVSSKSLYDENYLSLFFGKQSELHQANIGYGVSYILPIIIAGLIAQKGSLLVIENPELHLHPKAQSYLSYFLAFISSTGVQVIIETHSDHIVNGYRKAVLDMTNGIKNDDIEIHYFSNELNNGYETIKLNSKAELDHWPVGFMDQTESDLFEIRRSRLSNE